ncbi:2,3-dihydroxybiphenyl 1,2-dioxygenase [Marinobacterium lacunae]|uniref:2,3-dihydroxybiphenyl 1,2-dioxygenase n=1 Tax=Marinobacterium lacunae TaxID=1232683 RepID=A0A081FZF9_9GAMM|nr:VOC family protein [Marinobacterium lacunae]KEA63914.1 2,3-dihydroxybiphenyl 1,2-dioxygenase [Marinobacterium lacunae]
MTIDAHLDHLALGSPNPEALATFYATALRNEAKRTDAGWMVTGPGRKLLISEGDAKELKHFAYGMSAEALASLRARLESKGVTLEPCANPYLDGEVFAVTDPDGNRSIYGVSEKSDLGDMPYRARLQHMALATTEVDSLIEFYRDVIGLSVSDNVLDEEGELRACFLRSDEEHHVLAVFKAPSRWFDHHCYEAGDWNLIRDWADHLSTLDIELKWGPGRHGPGNNLFFMIHDPDGNWVEISAELEVMEGRPAADWLHTPKTLNYWGQAFLRS